MLELIESPMKSIGRDSLSWFGMGIFGEDFSGDGGDDVEYGGGVIVEGSGEEPSH